jgi:hypothetical protein
MLYALLQKNPAMEFGLVPAKKSTRPTLAPCENKRPPGNNGVCYRPNLFAGREICQALAEKRTAIMLPQTGI